MYCLSHSILLDRGVSQCRVLFGCSPVMVLHVPVSRNCWCNPWVWGLWRELYDLGWMLLTDPSKFGLSSRSWQWLFDALAIVMTGRKSLSSVTLASASGARTEQGSGYSGPRDRDRPETNICLLTLEYVPRRVTEFHISLPSLLVRAHLESIGILNDVIVQSHRKGSYAQNASLSFGAFRTPFVASFCTSQRGRVMPRTSRCVRLFLKFSSPNY